VPTGFGLRPGPKAPDEPPSPTGHAPPLDSTRYPALPQSGQASSNSGPIRSGALPAQGHPLVLAVDNASVRLAPSHVHTGFAERLPADRSGPGDASGSLDAG
jgi:hypothetical protein